MSVSGECEKETQEAEEVMFFPCGAAQEVAEGPGTAQELTKAVVKVKFWFVGAAREDSIIGRAVPAVESYAPEAPGIHIYAHAHICRHRDVPTFTHAQICLSKHSGQLGYKVYPRMDLSRKCIIDTSCAHIHVHVHTQQQLHIMDQQQQKADKHNSRSPKFIFWQNTNDMSQKSEVP